MASKLQHKAPDWVDAGSQYFITACAEPRGLNHFCEPAISSIVLNSIRMYHQEQKWFCSIALLMPDHIHLLLSISPDRTLTRTLGLWKRWLARHHAVQWQGNFFDHRLRRDESLAQKRDYILQNPVRAGLVDCVGEWPYFWMPAQ